MKSKLLFRVFALLVCALPLATSLQFMASSARADTVPVVSGVSPSVGPLAGGTSVTISGSGFTGATAVDFGGVPAASFSVVSDSEVTAVSPAQSAGPVDVTVTAPGG
jgi:hypothetical protein